MTAPAERPHDRLVPLVEPGVYDLSPDVYHADPVAGRSISSSGARWILPPGCPAKFRWRADHPEAPKTEYDIGHAVHRIVLGAGAELVVVDAANYNTKAAREARDAAYAAGQVPLLTHQHDQVQAMAAAVLTHPVAGALFRPGTGRPEQSLVWFDDEFRVWRRAMLDWLRERQQDGRLVVPDLKTCLSADPAALSRAMADHHYEQQAAWNEDAVKALRLHGDVDAVFLLVFVEKDPPHLINIVMPDDFAIRMGRLRNRKALAVFAECQRAGRWPGYSETVEKLGLPRWAEFEYQAALDRGDLDSQGVPL